MAKAATAEKKVPVGEVLLPNVRLSFAELEKPGKPRKNDAGVMVPGKYHCNLLIPKKGEHGALLMKKIKKAAQEAKEKKWGDKIPNLKADRVAVRDGDLEDWDGYAGMFYVSCSNPEKPSLITRQKDEKTDEWLPAPPGKIYSGCYVNALIRFWAQDSEDYGKRLNCSIEAVQYNTKGEAFGAGGPVDTKEKFSEIEEDEGDSLGYETEEDDEDEFASLV